MPKELNLVANERIDFEDFDYGTRVFTADSLRAHVNRIVAGGYRGGFILEGFRVRVSGTGLADSVSISNGIALDRSGRLITREDGSFFLNNLLSWEPVALLDNVETQYLSIEYTFIEDDFKERSFWDPTFENAAIKDSGDDNVPQPKGKEFKHSIPTRRSLGYTVHLSSTGFSDTVNSSSLRIPIAIVTVNTTTNVINIDSAALKAPDTVLIERPEWLDSGGSLQSVSILQCADTRIFDSAGTLEVLSSADGTLKEFGGPGVKEISYVLNDRNNSFLQLSAISAHSAAGPFCEVGDVVRQVKNASDAAAPQYIVQGSKYDCRPLFFSMTATVGASLEDSTHWPNAADGVRRDDTRQLKYWSGIGLLSDRNPATTTTEYPSAPFGDSTVVTHPSSRVEYRLKQNQDFFRALSALIHESRYGRSELVSGFSTSLDEDSTSSANILTKFGVSGTGQFLQDSGASFTSQYEGSYVVIKTCTVGTYVGKRERIKRVYGDSLLELETTLGITPIPINTTFVVELNYPADDTAFVDAYKIGSLREVYNSRVDETTNTYTGDLARRLSANKVATITVGNGVTNFGDYNGNAGLAAAIKQAHNQRGGRIFVREGEYTIAASAGALSIGTGTSIVGEGAEITKIIFGGSTSGSSSYLLARDYDNDFASPATKISRVKNLIFKDITLSATDNPIFSNAPLEFQTSPGTAAPNTPANGTYRTNWNSADNSCSFLENVKFDNVYIDNGGFTGNWSPDTGANAVDCSYSIYIVGDPHNNQNKPNKDLRFTDCEITVNGGGILLGTCIDVSFKDCKFQGGNAVEGVTFFSQTSTSGGADQNFRGAAKDGNVSIVNCKFIGEKKSIVPFPATAFPGRNKRGWINFTPSYRGVNVSILGCQFQGDQTGVNTSTSTLDSPREFQGEIKKGACIVKNGGYDLLVSNCNFGNYVVGIISQRGDLTVSGCNFFQVGRAVVANQQFSSADNGSWNYRQFGAIAFPHSSFSYWGVDYHEAEAGFNTTVSACVFSGVDSGSSFGISPTVPNVTSDKAIGVLAIQPAQRPTYDSDEADSFLAPRNVFDVTGCKFSYVKGVLDTDALKPGSTANIMTAHKPWQWELISVSSCTMEGVDNVVFDRQNANWHATTTGAYSSRTNVISNIIYQDNKHYRSLYDTRTANDSRGFIGLAAEKLVIKNNTFSNIRCKVLGTAVPLNPIFWAGTGASGIQFNGNEFVSCRPGEGGGTSGQMTMLQVSILNTYEDSTSGSSPGAFRSSPPLIINDNIFNPGNTTESGIRNGCVSNGVFIEGAYKPNPADLGGNYSSTDGVISNASGMGEHFWPILNFNNNELYLQNGNFGLLSKQYTNYVDDPALAQPFANEVANLWSWYSVCVNNNKIVLDIKDSTNNFKYANDMHVTLEYRDNINVCPPFDAGFNSTAAESVEVPYLGAVQTTLPVKLYACLDIRMMARPFTTDSGSGMFAGTPTESSSISNNALSVRAEKGTGIGECDDKNKLRMQCVMGIRVSQFSSLPCSINNNTFVNAPLILRWVFLCPYQSKFSGGLERIGFKFSIDNNSFTNSGLHVGPSVYVNNALGYGTSASWLAQGGILSSNLAGPIKTLGDAAPPWRATNQLASACLSFSGNEVNNNQSVMKTNQWPFTGCVWFDRADKHVYTTSTFGGVNAKLFDPLGAWGLGSQCYGAWHWKVTNNNLYFSYFIVDAQQDGGWADSTNFMYGWPDSDGDNPTFFGEDFESSLDVGAEVDQEEKSLRYMQLKMGLAFFANNFFRTAFQSEGQDEGGQDLLTDVFPRDNENATGFTYSSNGDGWDDTKLNMQCNHLFGFNRPINVGAWSATEGINTVGMYHPFGPNASNLSFEDVDFGGFGIDGAIMGIVTGIHYTQCKVAVNGKEATPLEDLFTDTEIIARNMTAASAAGKQIALVVGSNLDYWTVKGLT